MSDCVIKKVIKEYIDNIINEAVSKKCFDDFGNYLFGEFSTWYGEEVEKNTKKEQDVFDNVYKFISGEYVSKSKDAKLVKALTELQKCMSSYKQIAVPDTNDLWRGYGAKSKDILPIIKSNKKEIYTRIKQGHVQRIGDRSYYKLTNNFTYVPESEVQSWSRNSASAEHFTNIRGVNQGIIGITNSHIIGVLINHKSIPKSQLIFNSEFLSKLAKNIFGTEEFEIIRIGKSLPNCDLYVNSNHLYLALETEMEISDYEAQKGKKK